MAGAMIQTSGADPESLAFAEREWLARRLWRRHLWRVGFVAALTIVLAVLLAGISIPVGIHLATGLWLGTLGGAVQWDMDETNWRQGGITRVSFRSRWQMWNNTFSDDDLHYLLNLHRVVSLNIAECDKITSNGLTTLRGLEFLTDLDLARLARYRFPASGGGPVPLDETCLVPVAGLGRLENLSLAGNLITDRGLSQIAKMANLKFLDLSATEITDKGLIVIQGMTRLESVSLGATRVTKGGLTKLQTARPDLWIELYVEPEVEHAVKLARGATR
jgi:hypothetical protein